MLQSVWISRRLSHVLRLMSTNSTHWHNTRVPKGVVCVDLHAYPKIAILPIIARENHLQHFPATASRWCHTMYCRIGSYKRNWKIVHTITAERSMGMRASLQLQDTILTWIRSSTHNTLLAVLIRPRKFTSGLSRVRNRYDNFPVRLHRLVHL